MSSAGGIGILCVGWVALALAPPVVWRTRPGAWKRRVGPLWMGALGLLAAGIAGLFTSGGGLIFLVAVVGVLTASAIKGTRYCDTCGAIAVSFRWWDPPRVCPRCGKRLD